MGEQHLLSGALYLRILRILMLGPLDGAAIARRIREASARGIEVEDESLYAALDHMLVKGWLTTEGVMSENNRKVQIYRVSGDGVTQLKREDLRSWSARSKKRF